MKCWMSRLMIVRCQERSRPVPGWVGSHMARCPACHRFFRFLAALQRGLAEGAQTVDFDPEDELVRRVSAALARGAAPANGARHALRGRPAVQAFWTVRRMAAAATLALAAAVGLVWLYSDSKTRPPQPEAPQGAFDTFADVARELLVSVDPPPENRAAWLASAAKPLTEEAERLSADAAMVKNFIQALFAAAALPAPPANGGG